MEVVCTTWREIFHIFQDPSVGVSSKFSDVHLLAVFVGLVEIFLNLANYSSCKFFFLPKQPLLNNELKLTQLNNSEIVWFNSI